MDKSVMKKIILALALLFAPTLAWGQCNGVFAAGAVCGSAAGGVPGPAAYTPSFPLTIGGLTINSAAAVRSLNVGSAFSAAQPAEFNINDNQAPADSRMGYFGVNTLGLANGAFINASFGSAAHPVNSGSALITWAATFDSTAAKNQYNAEWHNYTVSAGTGGGLGNGAMLIQCNLGGAWIPDNANLAGCTAVNAASFTTLGGFVWGVVPSTTCTGTVGCNMVAAEFDTVYGTSGTGSKVGIQIVDQMGSTQNPGSGASVAFKIVRDHLMWGWDVGVLFPAGDGVNTDYPIRTTGTLIQSGAGTFAHGVDLSAGTCSTDCFKSVGYTVDGSGNTTETSARTPGVLVSALPSCAAGIQGTRMFVTDQATAIAYHGAVTGSGAFKQSVVCDGTSWYQD